MKKIIFTLIVIYLSTSIVSSCNQTKKFKDSPKKKEEQPQANSKVQPVANAGEDIETKIPQKIQLIGNGTPQNVEYLWTIDGRPNNSQTTLSLENIKDPEISLDLPGVYTISLIVKIGDLKSKPDILVITARSNEQLSENTAPFADAGKDQEVSIGMPIKLDASKSQDPNGDTIKYNWIVKEKPDQAQANIESPNSVSPTLTVDKIGEYLIELQLDDQSPLGENTTSSDRVHIKVTEKINQRPTANAGKDQTAQIGSVITMDGSESFDPENNTLSYQWEFSNTPTGFNGQLSENNKRKPNFTPNINGVYKLKLIVNDGQLASEPDLVEIFVNSESNARPVANAGINKAAIIGELFQLDGSASSDGDQNTLNFIWSIKSAPDKSQTSLSKPTSAKPYFVPDLEGDYIFQLTVFDGVEYSLEDLVVVSATSENLVPFAAFTPSETITKISNEIILDASGSFDLNKDPLQYFWKLIEKPEDSKAFLEALTSEVKPTFNPDVKGEYVIQLTVDDGTLKSEPVNESITVFSDIWKFSWTQPLNYDNEVSFDLSKLGGFKIYIGKEKGVYPNVYDIGLADCEISEENINHLNCSGKVPSGDINVSYFVTINSYLYNGLESIKADAIQVKN